MEVSVHRGGFNLPGEPHEGATQGSRSEFCLVFSLIVFRATPVVNVWPPRSKSVRSQVSMHSSLDRDVRAGIDSRVTLSIYGAGMDLYR